MARQQLGKIYPSFFPRQRLVKNVPAATNTGNNFINVERIIFYAVRVISRETGHLFLPRPSCYVTLLNISVKNRLQWVCLLTEIVHTMENSCYFAQGKILDIP
jgi:hypothetical protein